MIHQRIGDLDKAELALRKAVTLAPEATSPQLNLAVVLISKKQEGLAEEILKRAVERDNRNSELFTVLGWAELQLGKFKDAEEHLRRAVELDGKNAAAHNNLGVLFSRQGKKDEARREFNTALSLNSALDSARRNLSELE
jgi:Flp pilus assembly protein TadD